MPNVYVATGFNAWGMTNSMVAANLLTDLLCGRKNPMETVLRPDRSMLRKQLSSNLGTTVKDFAIPTVKRCSHLGCALRWNPQEHSWDCPCHGSRFTENGRLLDTPAQKDAHTVDD
jgi:Rieske Fe-S protein